MSRPLRLTPEVEARILDSVRAGNSDAAAAETSGLGVRTVERYLQRARAANTHLETHLATLSPLRQAVLDRLPPERFTRYLENHVPPGELIFWRFGRAHTRARAEAEERAVSLIREAGLGYEAEETITERRQVLGKDGVVVTLTSTRTVMRHVRDWRAEAWWLEKSRRAEWGRSERLEVTGAEGGPVEVKSLDELKARAVGLVDQVAERRRQRAEAEALAAGSVVASNGDGPPV